MAFTPPPDVGILGLYVHFPRYYVEQADLEAAHGCPGKYTAGLGQLQLGFACDREDAPALAATAALKLLEAYGLRAADVGRLEVGTETAPDRSKSVASYVVGALARYLGGGCGCSGCSGGSGGSGGGGGDDDDDCSKPSGCGYNGGEGGGGGQSRGCTCGGGGGGCGTDGLDILAVDSVHGCYGGAAALLHAADWVRGPDWDGRPALVVAADVAIYEPGSPARATGGAGAAALLVGPRAPLALDAPPLRGHFAAHAFDFFKPHSARGWPAVDGPATLFWYLRAADAAGAAMWRGLEAAEGSGGGAGARPPPRLWEGEQLSEAAAPSTQQQQQKQQQERRFNAAAAAPPALLPRFDWFVAHAPFNKLVAKALGRLALADALRVDAWLKCRQQQQQSCIGSGSGSACAGGSGCARDANCNGAGQQQQQQQEGALGDSSSSSSSSAPEAALKRPARVIAPPPEAAALDPARLSDASVSDKALAASLAARGAPLYASMAARGAALQRRLGNLYAASVFSGLAGLLESLAGGDLSVSVAGGDGGSGNGSGSSGGSATAAAAAATAATDNGGGGSSKATDWDGLVGRRVLLYSYGSGAEAALLSLRLEPGAGRFTLAALARCQNAGPRLAARLRRAPRDYDAAAAAARRAQLEAPYEPEAPVTDLEPGAVYLARVDERHRRHYARAPPGGSSGGGGVGAV